MPSSCSFTAIGIEEYEKLQPRGANAVGAEVKRCPSSRGEEMVNLAVHALAIREAVLTFDGRRKVYCLVVVETPSRVSELDIRLHPLLAIVTIRSCLQFLSAKPFICFNQCEGDDHLVDSFHELGVTVVPFRQPFR